MTTKSCIDCEPGSTRPTPYPGPRCATHHREIRKIRKAAAHEKRVGKVYGLEPGEYAKLYEAQGGTCAICQKARGLKKRLAVDHDHETGLIRGLACTWCNHEVLGRLDVEALLRAARYLLDPPGPRVLGNRYYQGDQHG